MPKWEIDADGPACLSRIARSYFGILRPIAGQPANPVPPGSGEAVVMKELLLFAALIGLAHAQAPSGAIAGVVRDPSGVAVAGAHVRVVSTTTGLERSAAVSEQGGAPLQPRRGADDSDMRASDCYAGW